MKGKFKHFFLFIPLLLLLGIGVLVSTAKKASAQYNCGVSLGDGNYENGQMTGFFEGEQVGTPEKLAEASQKLKVLADASSGERWVEVDLSDQMLKAWDGSSLFLETKVSTGLPWWPTPKGEFRIWSKFKYTKMEGGEGRYYYYLPNVPYVMFFQNDKVPGWRGFNLHGTYWHNSFGTPRSHGCVNLPTPIAEKLFYWTATNSKDNLGTRIVIHD